MNAINSMSGSILCKAILLHLFRWNQIVLVFALIIFLNGNAEAACSPYKGQVVINEYNYIDNWIELKVLDSAAITSSSNFSGWKVTVFKQSPSTSTTKNVGTVYTTTTQNTCDSSINQTYIQIPFAPANMDNDVNVVLADSNNDIVDVFRVDQSALATYYSGFNACSITFSNMTDAPLTGSSSNKDIARLPDGTGPWVISNGTGNNSQQSLCTSNDALFALTKTPSSATVGIGSGNPFTWTITVKNGGTTGNLSNVTVSDTLPTNMFLSVCPAGATCGGGVGAYTSFSINVGTLRPVGSTPNAATISASAYVTIAGTYTNTAQAIADELAPGYTQASGTVSTSSTPASFNAFETTTPAAAITGVIQTKIAGSAFALAVVAISAGAQANGFTNNVKVELLANGTPGSGYGTDNCPTSNSVIQTINSAAISGGRSTVNFSAVADSYRDVRVRISYPTTFPTVTACSTNSFAIRPNTLALSVTDDDWQTAGTTNILNSTSATGTPMHKAGRPFTVSSTAQNAAAATTTNYAGTPALVLSSCSPATACTSTFGTFSLGGGSYTSGVLSSTTASYTEVGAFNLQLQDTNYASIDSGDTAADCTGYYVCSPVTAVGRFVPDHFKTVITVLMGCASGLTCPALDVAVPGTTGMVYAGQNFTTQITARNAAGATTANYSTTTGLSKAVTLAAWDALGGTATQNPPGGTSTLANSSVAASSFSAGVASIANSSYSFATVPTVPTDIYLRAKDDDNVTSLNATPSSSLEGGVKVVNGRIKIANAYGSELLPLTLAATVQYYNAAGGWATSSSDLATTFVASDFALAFPAAAANNLAACETALSVSGSSPNFRINLSAPGAGNSGWTDMTLNLGAVATGSRCTVVGGAGTASTTANRPWLQLPVGSNPEARATFGVYSGGNNFIYQRESY